VTTLLDTGPLVAAAHREDDAHTVCARLFAELQGALLLPSTVLIEACWMINARMGANAHANFLGRLGDDIASDRIRLVDLAAEDVDRMGELVRTYRDLGLDPTDASVIAMAERLGVKQVATLDRRDFSVVRPRHIDALQLLP
jgi:predicted nucleic acid-binding protein